MMMILQLLEEVSYCQLVGGAASLCSDTSQATKLQDGSDGSSMLRDIGQCVLFIGGVSLVMWIGFMIVYTQLPLPSELLQAILTLIFITRTLFQTVKKLVI